MNDLPAYLDATFGAHGHLARIRPGYSPRPTQIDLAVAVDTAFTHRKPALVEGGCGVGKSLAYLVPGIEHALRNGSRLIVATGSNALLDQLARGDDCELAVLSRALPRPFRYATLKGRSNYVCMRDLEAFTPEDEPQKIRRDSMRRLQLWAEQTTRGDRGEAPEADAREHWYKLATSPDKCTKPTCIFSKRDPHARNGAPLCHAEKARDLAKDAHVIVTNHHLLSVHLRHGMVLPEHEYVVIDEAHDFMDTFREFYGNIETVRTIDPVVGFAMMLARDGLLPETVAKELEAGWASLFQKLDRLTWDPFAATLRKPQLLERQKLITKPLAWSYPGFDDALARIEERAKAIDADAKRAAKEGLKTEGNGEGILAARAIERVRTALKALLTPEDPNPDARWVEVDPRGVRLKIQPISVAGLLRTQLFAKTPATVLASATLTVGDTFEYLKSEVGLRGDEPYKLESGETLDLVPVERVVASPFDHRQQCLLVLPPMPDPKKSEDDWVVASLEALEKTIALCDGRTLGLYTSKKRLEIAAAWIRQNMPKREILCQGEGSPRELVQRFKASVPSSLLGTGAFWTGIDVQGEALTAVVIDRLPTPSPEPLLEAMRDRLGEGYWNYLFSRGALRFRQGIGRAVRSKDDVAVVVICDPRLTTRAYGRVYLQSLPEMTISRNLDDIPAFLRQARAYVVKQQGDETK